MPNESLFQLFPLHTSRSRVPEISQWVYEKLFQQKRKTWPFPKMNLDLWNKNSQQVPLNQIYLWWHLKVKNHVTIDTHFLNFKQGKACTHLTWTIAQICCIFVKFPLIGHIHNWNYYNTMFERNWYSNFTMCMCVAINFTHIHLVFLDNSFNTSPFTENNAHKMRISLNSTCKFNEIWKIISISRCFHNSSTDINEETPYIFIKI